MKRFAQWVILLCILAIVFGCRTPLTTVVLRGKVRRMTIPREQLTKMDYLVQLPRGYDEDTNCLWPMVFYLHGIGESGNDLKKVIRFGPPRLVAQGKDLPCIVVSPQVAKGYFWFRESNMMLAILDEVMKNYRVDKRRVCVTGNSMGAFGAVVLAAREPERFASLVPICGGVDYVDSLRLRDVPIWAFHGEKDPIIPVEESRRLVRLVNEIGGHARLTLYSDLGHNCWDRAYDDPALWEWILAQKK
jgi:predicted peptidase